MTPPQQPIGTGRDVDPENMILMALAIIVVATCLALLLWYEFHTQLSEIVLYCAGAELRVIALFTHQYDQVLINLAHAKPENVSSQTLWDLCTLTGQAILLPSLGLFILIGALCGIQTPRAIYRQRFGLEGMTRMLAKIHPIGQAWVGGAAKLTPPAPEGKPLRPMDPPLTPGEWLQRYAPGEVSDTETVHKCHDALLRQLGTPWRSPVELSTVELCLFMVFNLYYIRQKDQAQALLEALSAALSGHWKKGEIRQFVQLDKAFTQKMKKAYATGNWTSGIEIASRHAYVRPALMSLLQEARKKSGVVNPSLFSIVQLVDRDLWLILCALSYPMPGRPLHAIVTTSCTEAAGALEHWRAECLNQKPSPEPQLAQTLTSLMTSEARTHHGN